MTPDEVCEEYADNNVGLCISIIPMEGQDAPDLINIEGDETSLRFLGELLISISTQSDFASKQIFPRGPGNVFFKSNCSLGIYLHKVR